MALRPEAIMNMENSIQNAATKKMMNNSNGEGEPEPENPLDKVSLLSPQKMQEWNSFIKYAKEKGFAGKPSINEGNMGNKLFDEWKKANPSVSISKDDMPSVRKTYLKLRDDGISELKAKKSIFKYGDIEQTGPTGDYSKYMPFIIENEKTSNPNYIGQNMTMMGFPESFVRVREKGTGKVIGEERKLRDPRKEPGQQSQEMLQSIEKKPIKNSPL